MDRPSFLLLRRELAIFGGRMARLGAALATVLAFGTIALALTEHRDAWYAFQWALDTVSTIGDFPRAHSTGGQVVSVLLIVLGVGTLLYALVSVAEFFVAGHLGVLRTQRRMQKMIDSLSDHYIICGYGRVGRQVARDLHAAGARYVVIDDNPANRELIQGVGVRYIDGDASQDDVLRSAGIDRARAILACADSDADNIFVTLTARELCPGIAIVARASVEDSEKKLKRAGADRVISPYKASGTEMARLALHPQIAGVVDVDGDYRMEEIVVSGTPQTVGDVQGGAIIVGVRRSDGTFQPQPAADTVLDQGDVVMALGTAKALERLERLFLPGSTAPGGEGEPSEPARLSP